MHNLYTKLSTFYGQVSLLRELAVFPRRKPCMRGAINKKFDKESFLMLKRLRNFSKYFGV